jgi:hypothetical protein
MSNHVKSMTFVAEGPDYVLMADSRGALVRVQGLSQAEVDELAGRDSGMSPYSALIKRIAQLS